MGLIKNIKTIISKRKEIVSAIIPKKQTSSQTEIPATKLGGITVTDFQNKEGTEGGSITTTTSPSGEVTKRTYHTTGITLTPELQQSMLSAKEQLDQSQANKLASGQLSPQLPPPTTDAGKKLNRELGALSTENTKYENKIQTNTNNYANSKFSYYQNLVNKGKLSVDEANAKYKKDVENYQQALIDDENRRRKQAYANVIDINAVSYIGEFQGIADQTSFTPEKEKFFQKVGSVAKAIYVSTPFGTATSFREGETEKLTQARYDNVIKSLLTYGGGGKLGFLGFAPFKSSLEAVREEKRSQYSAEQQTKLFNEFNTLVSNAPDELKYSVQDKGLTYLAQKGMRFDEISEEGVVSLTGKDFDRRINQNILEWERAKKTERKIDDILVGTRIVSTKALESYGIMKGLGYVGGTIGNIFGKGKVLANFGDPVIKKIATSSLKLTAGGVLAGLYTTSLYEKSSEYKGKSPQGKGAFWLETSGELGGLGLVLTEGAVARYRTNKINKIIEQENYLLKMKKAGLLNIKNVGQFSERALVTYEQAGIGIKLTPIQEGLLAEEYSKVAGISQKEALQLIKETSFYETKLKIPSTVPSTERALRTLKTGEIVTGSDIKEFYRRGFVSLIRDATGKTQEIAFEFTPTKRGIKEIQLKTLAGEDNFAISNIFEKARISKNYPDTRFILKENILSKIKKIKIGKVDNVKFSYAEVENRLLKINPYGKEKLKLDELLQLGRSRAGLEKFDALWEKAGSVGKSSEFAGLRFETPRSINTDIAKILSEDQYLFVQKGKGKRFLALKNILKDMDFEQFIKQTSGKRTSFAKTFGFNEETFAGTGAMDKATNQLLKEEILGKQAVQNQILQQSSQSGFKIDTKIRLKNVENVKNLIKEEVLLGAGFKSISVSKQKSVLKEDIQEKLMNKQMEKVLQSLGVKQMQSSKSKQLQMQSLMSELQMPKFNLNAFNPLLSTSIKTPKVYRPRIIDFEGKKRSAKLKELLKMKKITELGLLPDFTARIVGLPSEEFSMKDIEKQLMKIETGAGIRTGARLKWL